MSGRMYSISYISDEERRIRAAIQERLRKEQEKREKRQKVLSKLDWTQTTSEDFKLPEQFTEIEIPASDMEDGLDSDVPVFVSSSEETGISLSILDHTLPDGKCEEIASKFAQDIYRNAVGEEIPKDNILIQPIARLKHPVCQHCLKIILDFPYQCPVCEKVYCYPHRRPESHGCSRPKNTTKTSHRKKTQSRKNQSSRKSNQPKVIIREIPCG